MSVIKEKEKFSYTWEENAQEQEIMEVRFLSDRFLLIVTSNLIF